MHFLCKPVFNPFCPRLLRLLVMSLFLSDVKRTDRVQDEPRVEIYFQSDSRAAGMKDMVREFIRKATEVGVAVCVCVCEREESSLHVSSCACTCMYLHMNGT